MNWKPIDTAPKDGTYVLLRRAGLTTTDDTPIMPPAVARCSKRIHGKDKQVFYDWLGVDSSSPILGRPTHWMPLPN